MIRRLFTLFLVLSLVGCASMDDTDVDDQTPRSRYGGDVGEYPVGVIPQAVLHDATRNKDLEMSVEYPIKAGTFPLIIFSPEFASSARSYPGLTSFWASQGYVVVKPQHADALRSATTNSNSDRGWQDQTPADWKNRVRDVTFVIDALDQLVTRFPELQGKIDKAKIGVAGHGYGAFTALLAAGMRTTSGGAAAPADNRIKAVIAMSPQGPSQSLGLTRESWSDLKLPALFMTGTKETARNETETVEWREQPFELAAAGDKWLMVLENGTASAFTGEAGPLVARNDQDDIMNRIPMGDPRDPRNDPSRIDPRTQRASGMAMMSRNQFITVRLGSLAFWDAYLRGDTKGRETLEQMASRSGVELRKR